jgi:hypothetical protein
VSFVFLVGTRPLGFILSNAADNYVGKLIMAVLLTPLIYLGHSVFHRHFHLGETRTPSGDEISASPLPELAINADDDA